MVARLPGAPAPLAVLVATEPRAYREALAVVLAELVVDVVAPEHLDAELTGRRSVVDCSRPTAAVRACAWIVLYPGTERVAVAGGPWDERAVPRPDL